MFLWLLTFGGWINLEKGRCKSHPKHFWVFYSIKKLKKKKLCPSKQGTSHIGKAHSCLASCLLGIVTPLCLFSELGQLGGKDQEGIWKGQACIHSFPPLPCLSIPIFLISAFLLSPAPPRKEPRNQWTLYTLRCESFASRKRHLYFSENLMVQQEIGQHLTKSPAPLMKVFL